MTEEKIKRIKVDCLYGKKKHFNAADRKENYHYWIGIPLTAINIITGTVLFYVFTHGTTEWVKFIPVLFAFVASVLSGFQTYFNFNKKVEGNRRVGNRYLAMMKKTDRLQGYFQDQLISKEDLVREIELVCKEIDDINKEAEQYPTSDQDYQKAKRGIESGEEEYTAKELEL